MVDLLLRDIKMHLTLQFVVLLLEEGWVGKKSEVEGREVKCWCLS